MIDLPTLGRELRQRRRALRIPSAEFARRIGVSQTYVWLIEAAKPRPSGEPSRPSEDVLQRWTEALGMTEPEALHIHELAGYFDSDALRAYRDSRPSPRQAVRSSSPPVFPRSENELVNDEDMYDPGGQRSNLPSPLIALQRWAGAEYAGADEETLAHRIHNILQRADRTGRSDEAAYLLDSLLRWLEFHVEERP
jgi:transcriptional regulator with XRE-family HTH domain